MILSIELTDTEYIAIQNALTKAYFDIPAIPGDTATPNYVDRLELLHLQTLLAEASIKEEQ